MFDWNSSLRQALRRRNEPRGSLASSLLEQQTEEIVVKPIRKIQLITMAVILNGVLALTSLAPNTALASSCSGKWFCGFCPITLDQCQLIADPGCTATFVSGCGNNLPLGPCAGSSGAFCTYRQN